MDTVIREAQDKDLDEISKIALICFPDDYISSTRKLDSKATAKQWIVSHQKLYPFSLLTVAEVNSTIIGFVLYMMMGGLSGVAHIEQVAVHPDFQRKGIGLKIMQESEELLELHMLEVLDTKLKKLMLTTSSENPASHDLYKKQGYTFVVNLGKVFFSGDEIMYEKVIK